MFLLLLLLFHFLAHLVGPWMFTETAEELTLIAGKIENCYAFLCNLHISRVNSYILAKSFPSYIAAPVLFEYKSWTLPKHFSHLYRGESASQAIIANLLTVAKM